MAAELSLSSADVPLLAHSRTVAERLVAMPQMVADEAHALGDRKRLRLRSAINGKLYNASSFMHPRRQVGYPRIPSDSPPTPPGLTP